MTIQEAKEIITELQNKVDRSPQDLVRLKAALKAVLESAFKVPSISLVE